MREVYEYIEKMYFFMVYILGFVSMEVYYK